MRPKRRGRDQGGRPPVVLVLDHTASLGGAELALVRLCEAVDPAEFDVRAILFEDGPLAERLRASGTLTRTVPVGRRVGNAPRNRLIRSPVDLLLAIASVLLFWPRLVRAILRERPDVIVTNSLKSTVLGAGAAFVVRRPWVWHLHDRLASDYLGGGIARVMVGLARHGPRAVVANSRHTLSLVEPLSRSRGFVAYPGVALETRRAAGAHTHRPHTFAIVGRLGETKGQREFLLAAVQVAREHPDVRFLVIGTAMFNDHGYGDDLGRMVDDLGLRDSTEFTGWIDDGTLWDRMDTVVHASPVAEPFGQVIVEAMAAGVPVIATWAGGVAEILDPLGAVQGIAPREIVETPYGILVRPGDASGLAVAMLAEIGDRGAAISRSGRAQERAREIFSIAVTAEHVVAAWRFADS